EQDFIDQETSSSSSDHKGDDLTGSTDKQQKVMEDDVYQHGGSMEHTTNMNSKPHALDKNSNNFGHHVVDTLPADTQSNAVGPPQKLIQEL
ncbi:unnamed protein product, partial [Heterosigma akashiwo]